MRFFIFRFRTVVLALIIGLATIGCGAAKIPSEALRWTPETLALRQLQTRRYDTNQEEKLLSASAAVLQDLGFTLDESETKLGLIVASKDRDAKETGQIVGSILLGVATAAIGVPVIQPWDDKQKIRVSLVTRSYGQKQDGTLVRVTFHRLVWDTANKISKLEQLAGPEMYENFFEKLSKSVFLEGHKI